MMPLPTTVQQFVDKGLRLVSPWIQYLQQFTIEPPDFITVDVDISPFDYMAEEPGNLVINGGTVSSIVLTRGTNSITIATSTAIPRIIPMGIKDTVTVTYTVLPTMTFIPAYGQNTTS